MISPETIKMGRRKEKRLVKMAIDTGGGACYNNANQISQLKDRGTVVKSSPGVRPLRGRCRRGKGPLPKVDMQDSPGQTNKIRLTVAFAESYGLIAEFLPDLRRCRRGLVRMPILCSIAADAAGVGCFCFPAGGRERGGKAVCLGCRSPAFSPAHRGEKRGMGALPGTPFDLFSAGQPPVALHCDRRLSILQKE